MSLLKNSFFNLLGAALPALVAIPSLGYMARELDSALFGVTMLIFALVGYAGVFDAGLAKAVVRHISKHSQQKDLHGRIIGTALLFVLATGSTACLILLSLNDAVVQSVFNVSPENHRESSQGLALAALCIPPFLASLVLQSYLEGLEKFKLFNIYRSASGVAAYILPAIFLYWRNDFSMLVAGLLTARIFSLFLIFALIVSKCSVSTWRFDRTTLRDLIQFGGWLTVTNIVSPFMVYMDRFFIAKLTGAQAVAFYSAPAELVNRMSILPVAIARAVFPRLASLHGDNESFAIKRQAYLYMSMLIAPVTLSTFLLAPWLIELWLGAKYVSPSTTILQLMLIGFFFNSLALIPYTSLQAKGNSFLTAKIHLFEVLPYLSLFIFFVSWKGIVGGAAVWSARMLIDFLVMHYFDSKEA